MSEKQHLAARALGLPGRMISASKSDYRERHPNHVAVFNANVCVERGKLWWGDLDLTLDEPLLQTLAQRLGEQVFVLYERDGRFEHEARPLLSRAVCRISPAGEARFDIRIIGRKDGTMRWLEEAERPLRTTPRESAEGGA